MILNMVVHQKRNIHVPYGSEDTKKCPGQRVLA